MEEKTKRKAVKSPGEDWWAVIVAFVLVLLAAIGILGERGLMIKF